MGDRQPTVAARELGKGLRKLMEQAKLDGRAAARRLQWDESKVSRLLSGKGTLNPEDVIFFLGLCQAPATERDRLMQICYEAKRPGWWIQELLGRRESRSYTFLEHEAIATRLTNWRINLVPGLLQTPDYMRAIFATVPGVPAEEVESSVTTRLARQALFRSLHRPEFTFLMHEQVLRLPIGGIDVLRDQLHHLLRMSVRTYISLRVVPSTAGAHAGLDSSFVFMEFSEIKPVVFLETSTANMFVEDNDHIRRYRQVLDNLSHVALSEEESRGLIAAIASKLGNPGEDSRDDNPGLHLA
ncbi:helix-turn-helix domain-containing protein [Goodfellowiella coeruleoviolacea]|uniref:Helix-turn-helix domain-containing protein n=1 Tax=Goodfellowiella coeruleoviolacea TaxID=334858 RepID=A0AAE3G9P3_9PSEU|nr:helix-turn-helix transcriptional regulator [Goodfellowiella coeruleoviolacea]MCP2164236.1 Helix-turn-helix domain-containing protein [Goodfellowiella coeruleoviolacea]